MDNLTVWSDSFFKALKPLPRLKVSEWADTYRMIAKGTSPEPGKWNTDRVPYLREVMDAFCEPKVQTVVFMASSQVAKSEMILNLVGYYASQDPSPMLLVQPTIEVAESFSKERVEPTFKETPVLAGLLDEGKDNTGASRKTSNTIRQKMFHGGGYIVFAGANAPAGLASRPIRVVLLDEVDRYPPSAGIEGDPIKLAIQRATNFHNRKICMASTPTESGVSNIEEWFEKSDKRRYYVPCPHCGSFQVLKWPQVKWAKDNTGKALPETAYYECEHCAGKIYDKHKQAMINAGYWEAEAESFGGIVGFHINSLYSPWVKFHQLVTEFVEATSKPDKSGLQEFINLKLGEAWVENNDAIEVDYIERRREFYNCELPEGVLCLTTGVDVQDDRLAVHIIGWGEGEESWVIRYFEIVGDPGGTEVWLQLDDHLMRNFSFTDGRRMVISAVCVDSGGHFTDDVYRFVLPREGRRVFAIKGYGGAGVPVVNNFSRNNRMKVALFKVGVDTAKESIYQRLKLEYPGAGYVHFPRETNSGCDNSYFKMLLSEKRVLKFEKGVKKFIWQKVQVRNEALDTFVYAYAALKIFNPPFDVLKARINDLPKEQVKQNAPLTTPRGRRVLSKGVQI